jgi:hypothetical protein
MLHKDLPAQFYPHLPTCFCVVLHPTIDYEALDPKAMFLLGFPKYLEVNISIQNDLNRLILESNEKN